MKKEKSTSKTEVKNDVQPAEASHLKNGHKWLAWVMGITALWVLVTFVKGLLGECDLPRSLKYLNVWYLVNMGVFTVMAAYSTFCIIKKCPSQIFWSASTLFLLVLQSVSLMILFFYQQDVAAINGIALFVWSICWYGYMLTAPAVEADLPSRHRSHSAFGHVVLGVMILSTVAYALMMSIRLLW